MRSFASPPLIELGSLVPFLNIATPIRSRPSSPFLEMSSTWSTSAVIAPPLAISPPSAATPAITTNCASSVPPSSSALA